VNEILKASLKQEKRTAKAYNGGRNAMSGAGWIRKADVKSEQFMIECKLKMDPNAKSYSIKAVDMRDLVSRAILDDRIPVLQIDLAGKRYVVLVEDDFLAMMGEEGFSASS